MTDVTHMGCRICNAPLQTTFCDLGTMPFSNSYITSAELAAGNERTYPLRAYVCEVCMLVQIEAFESPQTIFSDYAYFSSYSSTLLEHARSYCHMIVERLQLKPGSSFVIEIASNDGYLLQNFGPLGIRALGIEPAGNVAEAALRKGIATETTFFGALSAGSIISRHGQADLVVGNNVLAHVPDLHDFIEGVRVVLAPGGTATFEFPHLLQLLENIEYDTIYHEHFSYFSLAPLQAAFGVHDLTIVDVEELPIHGGSLRIYVQHTGNAHVARSTFDLLDREIAAGLADIKTYARFQRKVEAKRDELVNFLTQCKNSAVALAGYGAPAKANTLLNYCKIDTSLLPFTVDLNPIKQGKLLPGSHIPIYGPEHLFESKPAIVFILAWNLRNEIEYQLREISAWGGRFAVALPHLEVWARGADA